jgi:hypothetical protein
MKTEVAVNRVGIIRTPNQPMYRRFSVLVIHSQKRAQRLALSRLSKIAVIAKIETKKKSLKELKNNSFMVPQNLKIKF